MERIEKTVFLSYRRTNIPWALAIFQNLTQHGYDVFFDFNGIASGDFERIILANIAARAHFLVLLTPSALERCEDSTDWLRHEIETALESQRNIVPIFLDGFDFSRPEISSQLTGKLENLKRYNGMTVPAEYFDAAMSKMREKFLHIPLEAVLHPASPEARKAADEQRAAADGATEVQEKDLSAQQWFEQGFIAVGLDTRLACYNEAIRFNPDYAEAFKERAGLRLRKRDLDGALQDCDEAIRLKPDYADAYEVRSTAFFRKNLSEFGKKNYEAALRDCNQVLRLKPTGRAFAFRALVRRRCDDFEGALQDCNEAIRLGPLNPSIFWERAQIQKARGDLAAALQDCSEAIRLKPDYTLAFELRAQIHRARGDLTKALQDYNEAIRLEPDYAEPFFGRAYTRVRQGELLAGLQDNLKAFGRRAVSNLFTPRVEK